MIDRVKAKAATISHSLKNDLPSKLTQGVLIDKLRLEDGLQTQPDLFWQVSEVVAELISDRDRAKQALAEAEAEADDRIRKQAARSEEKYTVQEITALRIRDPAAKRAREALLKVQAVLGKWEALKETYQQRSSSLRGLVSLYTANYYGADADNQDSRLMREDKRRNYIEQRKKRNRDDD
jgi:hypothetical protein